MSSAPPPAKSPRPISVASPRNSPSRPPLPPSAAPSSNAHAASATSHTPRSAGGGTMTPRSAQLAGQATTPRSAATPRSTTSVHSGISRAPSSRDLPPSRPVGTFGGAAAPTIFAKIESVCPELSYDGEYQPTAARQQKSPFGVDTRRRSFVDEEAAARKHVPGPGHEAVSLDTFQTNTFNSNIRGEVTRADSKRAVAPLRRPLPMDSPQKLPPKGAAAGGGGGASASASQSPLKRPASATSASTTPRGRPLSARSDGRAGDPQVWDRLYARATAANVQKRRDSSNPRAEQRQTPASSNKMTPRKSSQAFGSRTPRDTDLADKRERPEVWSSDCKVDASSRSRSSSRTRNGTSFSKLPRFYEPKGTRDVAMVTYMNRYFG